LAALVKKQKKKGDEITVADLRKEKKGKVKFEDQEIPSDDEDFFGGPGGMGDALEVYEKQHQKTQSKKNKNSQNNLVGYS